MNLKMLLSVYTVFMATGVALLVVPSVVMSLYGVRPLDVLETGLARTIGALAFGLGVVCWNARTAEASKARDALILGLTVINGLLAVVAVLTGMAAAVGHWLLWAHAALYALFTVLFIVTGRQAMSAPTAGGGASTRM